MAAESLQLLCLWRDQVESTFFFSFFWGQIIYNAGWRGPLLIFTQQTASPPLKDMKTLTWNKLKCLEECY